MTKCCSNYGNGCHNYSVYHACLCYDKIIWKLSHHLSGLPIYNIMVCFFIKPDPIDKDWKQPIRYLFILTCGFRTLCRIFMEFTPYASYCLSFNPSYTFILIFTWAFCLISKQIIWTKGIGSSNVIRKNQVSFAIPYLRRPLSWNIFKVNYS